MVAACVGLEIRSKIPTLLKRISFLGDSSYSLYLMHALFFSVLVRSLAPLIRFNSHIRIVLCIALALTATAFAALAYSVVEKRIVRRLLAICSHSDFSPDPIKR